MKKAALILLVLFASCKKKDNNPKTEDPAPTPTPEPTVYYKPHASFRTAAYIKSSYDPRDSMYTTFVLNGSIVSTGKNYVPQSGQYQIVLSPTDSVKKGDKIQLVSKLVTYIPNIQQCTLRLNKAWIVGTNSITLGENSDVITPVVYSGDRGQSINIWEYQVQ